MKKRLVALVLCVMLVLGCTAVRAEEDPEVFEGLLLSMFDFSESACRNSSMNRSALAAIAYLEYQTSVDNAYDADFSQPFYVGFRDDFAHVYFFSEDGHAIQLLILGSTVAYSHLETQTPSIIKSFLTGYCDWVYTASASEMAEVFKTLADVL